MARNSLKIAMSLGCAFHFESEFSMLIGFFYFLDCHATLTELHGEITSFGFPTGYYNKMDCTWLIRRPHGEVIEITILHFDVQPDNSHQICR